VFSALGRFSCRFRWLVVAVWLVLLAAGLAATPQLSHVLQGGGFANPDSPGQKAADLIQKRLKQGPATVVVVFVGDSLDARSPEFQRYERQALAELTAARIPGLRSIATYATSGAEQLLSKDGRSSVAILTFDAGSQAVQQETGRIRAALGKSRLKAYVSGEPAVNADLSSASLSDLRRVELYALPVALIALVVVFGTLVAAALPVMRACNACLAALRPATRAP
jgi:RND superfamily putative drug exporter